MKLGKVFKNGLIDENPTFVQVLGMCPTLAVTTSAFNGIGMGLATTVVLLFSNMVISLLRNIIPSKVRIPAFIVIIASFVTMVDLLLQGYVYSLYESLGLFIPLIVVNCIVLARAEAFAAKNGVLPSMVDGLSMGLGFTCALTVIGFVRELFGAGTILAGTSLETYVMPSGYEPITILILAPGAFIVLGLLFAIFNKIKDKDSKKA
ncbi:electron transport complex subunit E [Vallitalea longa]|uniref:Ion-translocating oxidoreductase complex subunit E n=1 Tax=Vallitalea longa TaxID=2936439 RepID=A0A9W6DEW4_9FIRM|nr:electron transport complex subunit E [Vallitalea longa]GKX28877.1 electron transport complex subunit E [Vallitalea longa]